MKELKESIVQWIRKYFAENGDGCSAVIGISGGKDSSVVAALCVEALGKDRVVGVLMPNGIQEDIDCSAKLVEHLGISTNTLQVNIKDAYDSLAGIIGGNVALFIKNGHGELSDGAKTNLPARLRMAVLYAVAQTIPDGGRVANTCNRSEDYVGYSTKFGDAVGDFAPISLLLVEEVIRLGHELGLPADLVEKVPIDGLCGLTDEENLGFTYKQLDKYIQTGICDDVAARERIIKLHDSTRHKYRPMPVFFPGID
jgi:NAD+ synthase